MPKAHFLVKKYKLKNFIEQRLENSFNYFHETSDEIRLWVTIKIARIQTLWKEYEKLCGSNFLNNKGTTF